LTVKAKILQAKYEAELEFLGGRAGYKTKTFHRGGMDIFWIYTMWPPNKNK